MSNNNCSVCKIENKILFYYPILSYYVKEMSTFVKYFDILSYRYGNPICQKCIRENVCYPQEMQKLINLKTVRESLPPPLQIARYPNSSSLDPSII